MQIFVGYELKGEREESKMTTGFFYLNNYKVKIFIMKQQVWGYGIVTVGF